MPLRLNWEPFYKLPEGVSVAVGDRVRVMFAGRRYVAVVSVVDATPPEGMKVLAVQAVESEALRIPETDINLWRQVAEYYMCSVGEVFRMGGPPLRADENNERKYERLQKSISIREAKLAKARESTRTKPETIIRLQQELENFKRELADERDEVKLGFTLSELQQRAFDSVRAGLAGGKPVLLHGVTGSGKTELYLSLAAEVLRAGGNVLYLVPEIALSRQLEDRIRKAIPFVQVYHSAETQARKNAVSAALRSGQPYIVLGTRSALFLPHRGLKLVIVDEEHDTSYKQTSPAPCYHARETAVMLARIHGAGVVLGSATPSVVDYSRSESGVFERIELTERYNRNPLPFVEIVDMAAEIRAGNRSLFSQRLLDQIQRCLKEKKQIILFLNRRGYASFVSCRECGHTMRCPECGISYTYHQQEKALLCHYCGRKIPMPKVCPECGSKLIGGFGAGTEQVELKVKELFPESAVERLDLDTAKKKGSMESVLKRFGKGKVDILIGTQLVAKGLDFANVGLVGVISADVSLNIPDFRSSERTFQLITQVAGRSGRGDE
ncbi:MAG: primosomal protein N', partial [Bacteroidales bacterium]|nr:primosomal protein N' [Bacteroidales bacterium]